LIYFRDLLDPSKVNLNIREDKTRGIYIQDVTESFVTEEDDVYELMKLGNSNRAISATNMNEGYLLYINKILDLNI
jgi:kinesin family member 5